MSFILSLKFVPSLHFVPRSASWLCPSVPVHRGNKYRTPFFTNLCLAVEHCWVFCFGSCEPVYEDRAKSSIACNILSDSLLVDCHINGLNRNVCLKNTVLLPLTMFLSSLLSTLQHMAFSLIPPGKTRKIGSVEQAWVKPKVGERSRFVLVEFRVFSTHC